MFRMRVISSLVLMFAVFLSSCAPGSQFTIPPEITLVPVTDIPQQVATIVADALTQTAVPATSTSVPHVLSNIPGNSPTSQKIYLNSILGIQFSYPAAWYIQELFSSQFPVVMVTSFDPAYPPHKLEWTDQTISMKFSSSPLGTRPNSLDNWAERVKTDAQAHQLSIFAEERFLIANQPAVHITFFSGSGGIIHQVLTIINNYEIEIEIEGNYELAKAVLATLQPASSSGLKPSNGDTPAAGICGDAQGDPVNIILGIDASGLPLAGRCIAVNPTQRINLINQTNEPFNIKFAEYIINLPIGDNILLDKPVGEYLAFGIHYLPMGPELWVKAATPLPTITLVPLSTIATTLVATMPPPIVQYSNPAVGYKLGLPGDWTINESGMSNGTNKEVIFSPPYSTDPNIIDLSVSLDFRTLDQIINFYAQNVPNAVKEDTIFNGYTAIKYTNSYGRSEYYIPYGGKIFLIETNRSNDGIVQSILLTVQFTASTITTYEATIMENGKTFSMKIGDNLKINLDWSYNWSVISISDISIINGSQSVFQARAPGSSTLTAYGNPKCYSETPPCLVPLLIYTVSVIVQ